VRSVLATDPGRVAAALVALLAVAVLAGLVALWPDGDRPGRPPAAAGVAGAAEAAGRQEAGVVRAVREADCQLAMRLPCRRVRVALETGPDAGRTVALTMAGEDLQPRVEPGDRVRLAPTVVPEGADAVAAAEAGVPAPEPYAFADFERRPPLLALGALFALLAVVLGRAKGVRSLLGLGVSLLLVVAFVVPAIAEGRPPLLVGLVGALAVLLVTIALAHGPGPKALAAVLGAATSLVATALLALVAVELAHITGFGGEESVLIGGAEGTTLSLQGLVLAGIVVAGLGVLDDVAVSQASTVLALRRANPALRLRALLRAGLEVGRDHLSATVNTLVLAYVGASLPVLLVLETQGTGLADALNYEDVAGPVVGMLVGSIGLMLAVPLTTALAALLARRLPPEALPAHGHAH